MNEENLSNWVFEIIEISNGIYQLKASSKKGLKIELEGLDPEKLLLEFKKSALEINLKIDEPREN
ncbi:hypothetical protein QRD38_16485 [Leptospira weilii]|uniref:Uncharacterized protein n=1 Tax=Leptospira weilii str. UI 13098 TaxID=1088542 RepID=M6QAG0_9LEPT|nr:MULTISPECIES: hypothetical protein [Leptospira]EMN89588.1 hypothetical protein LEP1GSC108_3779 [Leptospira weilii str. UI 13098]MDL5247345.1 hypothetical protein [Leptospira weilii]